MGGKVAKIASRLLGLFSVAAVTISFGVVVTARCQETSSSAVSGSNPINIWVDATRKPGVEAYMKAHPDAPVNLACTPSSTAARSFRKSFRCGIGTGNGWPDAIFFGDVGDMAWASSPPMHYAATLNDLIPQTIQDGFSQAAILPCVDGRGSFACAMTSRRMCFGSTQSR